MPFYFVDATVGTTSAVLEFEFTGGDSSYGNYRPLRLTIDGTNYSRRVFDSDNKGSGDSYWTIRVTGLEPDTNYDFEAQLGYYTGSNASWLQLYADGSFVTEPEIPAVDYWSWTSSNGSATETQTKNAYAICQGTRTAGDFSHNVWNDIVDKANEVRTAKGYYWDVVDGKYLLPSDCKVNAGDRLSAEIYNSVRYNLGSIIAVGFADVSPGDEITGYHITRLTDVINLIIDSL